MTDEIGVKRALEDFRRAYDYKRKWLDVAEDDFAFALGRQWDDADVETLKEASVRPLTINKIRPNLFLLTGIESQNRSEFRAYPEGKEDSVVAEIATALLKNVMKVSHGDYKVSEVFEDGATVGECYLEPYLDYSYDLLGELKWKKTDYFNVFPQPGFKEYDLSDCEYVDKITYDLTKEQLLTMFPDSETEIEKLGSQGKISLGDNVGGIVNGQGQRIQTVGYRDGSTGSLDKSPEALYDLLEHHYKKYVKKFFIADQVNSKWVEAENKERAQAYVTALNRQRPGSAVAVERRVPEMWVCYIVGETEILKERAWFYPNWKSYPFIPYFAYRSTAPLRKEYREFAVQGVVRSMKDLQRELNKRRTQELRHLNTSANSGWLTPKGAWVDPNKAEKFGSSPGVNLEYKPEIGKPERITPTPLSQGHAQLAMEHGEDMKAASGINADLLAMQDGGQTSGKAIMLRQKQGTVMVQKLFDNLAQTKRIMGRFTLSQVSEIYDLESAMRVVGDAFISERFSEPVMEPLIGPDGQPIVDPRTGQPAMQPAVDPTTGQPQMQVNQEAAMEAFRSVLSDTQVGKYDVAIGENVNNETIQYGNYMMMVEMAQSGVQIPPDVLLESSLLPTDSKKKIREWMAMAAQNPKPATKGS